MFIFWPPIVSIVIRSEVFIVNFFLLLFCSILGHGRSVAVMCALLVALGVVEDWKNAERLVREKRPYIHMNALHCQALVEWSKDRLSSPVKKREIHITSPVMSDSSGGLRSVRTAKKNE